MNRNRKSWRSALILHHRPTMQVALPLCAALRRTTLDDASRAEVVAALARMLLEAAGVSSDEEVDDDA